MRTFIACAAQATAALGDDGWRQLRRFVRHEPFSLRMIGKQSSSDSCDASATREPFMRSATMFMRALWVL